MQAFGDTKTQGGQGKVGDIQRHKETSRYMQRHAAGTTTDVEAQKETLRRGHFEQPMETA